MLHTLKEWLMVLYPVRDGGVNLGGEVREAFLRNWYLRGDLRIQLLGSRSFQVKSTACAEGWGESAVSWTLWKKASIVGMLRSRGMERGRLEPDHAGPVGHVKDSGYPPESSGVPLRGFKQGGNMIWFCQDHRGYNVEDRLEGARGGVRPARRSLQWSW